jgi:hypothetical protein
VNETELARSTRDWPLDEEELPPVREDIVRTAERMNVVPLEQESGLARLEGSHHPPVALPIEELVAARRPRRFLSTPD